MIVLNKKDQPGTEKAALLFQEAIHDTDPDVWIISALTGEGVSPLKEHLARLLEKYRYCIHP